MKKEISQAELQKDSKSEAIQRQAYEKALSVLRNYGIDISDLSISDQLDLKNYIKLSLSESYIPKEAFEKGDYNPGVEAAWLFLKDLGISVKEFNEGIRRPIFIEVLDESGKIVDRLVFYTDIKSELSRYHKKKSELDRSKVKYNEFGWEDKDENGCKSIVRQLFEERHRLERNEESLKNYPNL